MVFDSIANASIPTAASNAKDFVKRKRANRSAKLKQCKLDARREQWLSQVKNKGSKEELNGVGDTRAPSSNERDRSVGNLEINPRNGDTKGLNHHHSDSDSPSNSPTSSLLGCNASGTNFTGSSSSSSSGRSSSGGCCSGSITEEDEEDECLDDWETVADALAATDDKQDHQDHNLEIPCENEMVSQLESQQALANGSALGVDMSKPKLGCPANSRAWRPDDAFRPQNLPNLLKQHSFPMKSDRHYNCGGNAWGCKNVLPAPSSCPICCEDLDFTDSSFLPCLCGFRLCLFCHKRILEEDGRCPGCRKQYDTDVKGETNLDGSGLAVRLARSYSMITRS